MQRITDSMRHQMNFNYGALRNVLLGGATAFALEKGYYLHLPIIFLFPSPYAGYQIYRNREDVLRVLHKAV